MGVVCGAHGIETLSILTTHTVDKHPNAHNAVKAQMLGNLFIGLSKALAGAIRIGQTFRHPTAVNKSMNTHNAVHIPPVYMTHQSGCVKNNVEFWSHVFVVKCPLYTTKHDTTTCIQDKKGITLNN